MAQDKVLPTGRFYYNVITRNGDGKRTVALLHSGEPDRPTTSGLELAHQVGRHHLENGWAEEVEIDPKAAPLSYQIKAENPGRIWLYDSSDMTHVGPFDTLAGAAQEMGRIIENQ